MANAPRAPEPIFAAGVASTGQAKKTERKYDEKSDARDGGRVCVGIAGGVGQRGAGSGAAERGNASVDGYRECWIPQPRLLVTQLCLRRALET